MLEKINAILDHFAELERRIADAGSDYQLMAELSKERSDLEAVVTAAQGYKNTLDQIDETEQLANSDSDELRALADLELEDLYAKRDTYERELKSLLIPTDPRDARNVIMEIRAGTGGDEAGLFAADLFRMYLRYAEIKSWKTEVMSINETGIGGLKEVIFLVKGKGAFFKA